MIKPTKLGSLFDFGDYKMILPEDSTDNMIRHCIDLGNPNLGMVGLIKSLLPRLGTILDIGANIGTISLPLAAADYYVVAVEGLPSNHAILEQSREVSGFNMDRLVAFNILASDTNGYKYIKDAGACSHVVSDGGVRVRAWRLDDSYWDIFDLIKIDIEGSEVRALRGMPNLLSRASFIIFESNRFALEDLGQTSPKELYDLVSDAGFDIYLIDENYNIRHPSTLLDGQVCMVVDYLGVKKGTALPIQVLPEYTAEELRAHIEKDLASPYPHQRQHTKELIERNRGRDVVRGMG